MRLAAAILALFLAALPAAAQQRDPSFDVVNQSDRVVFQIFASAASQRDWGRDHLGAAVLRPGQGFRVRLMPEAGCMTHIRVVFSGGASIERRNVNTCVERRLAIGAQAIVAQSEPPSGQDAGPPGGGKTAGGAAPTPRPTPGGEAQPRQPRSPTPEPRQAAPAPAEPRQGGPAAGPKSGGPVAGAPAPRPPAPSAGAARGNPSFWLVNASRRTIRELYASPSSQQNWGPDRLGTGVVGGGDRFAVRLPEGDCIYDVRVVWADGRPEDRRRLNLCDVIELVFE